MRSSFTLKLGWLYPDLMSTYGDRGNVLVLSKLCSWNGVELQVVPIQDTTTIEEFRTVDFIFGGGSQDIQQEIVMRDLQNKKSEVLKEKIEQNVPALFVCGAPQLMGKYYEPAEGKRIDGVGIFDMYTSNPGAKAQRCIGNIIAETDLTGKKITVVGFENHGGRTYLGKTGKPFATVLKGYGNNGEDKTEGVVYKNAVGCYFHGPLLPKNPSIATYLLQKAVEVKFKESIVFHAKDKLANEAKKVISSRYMK
jgi:CobQ-like glutamine amidotransferase family enzyme